MTRTISRRAALAVAGTGLAALTGAATRPSQCASISGTRTTSCGDALALTGPGAVASGGADPRFVARNAADGPLWVDTGSWELYRRSGAGDWTAAARGTGGGRVRLAPGERTAWVLLLADDGAGSGSATATASTRTRYVGPVAPVAGEHAFVVRGERDGRVFASVARFVVE